MKKMKFSLTLFLFFVSVTSLFGVQHTNSYSSNNMNWNNGDPTQAKTLYETVQVFCSPSACTLHCSSPGSGQECNWPNMTWCEGCVGSWGVWNSSNSEDMYEYALDKIENNVLSGQYSLHYINTSQSITYYRTVSWEFNVTTGKAEIDVVVTYDDGL